MWPISVAPRLSNAHYRDMKNSKTVSKSVANDALIEGRVTDALFILTEVMNLACALREMAPAPTATIGDILVASWGYDQTNVDWYQVIAVTKSSVRVRAIGGRVVRNSGSSDYVMPVRDSFIVTNHHQEPAKSAAGSLHRIQKAWSVDGRYSIKLSSYSDARLWDGTEERQTASGYGH